MTKQIETRPKSFNVKKIFGPFMGFVDLADDVTDALRKMTDKIIDDKKSESHGHHLAGVIEKELRIYKSDMIEFGVNTMMESCVLSYVQHCAKEHGWLHPNFTVSSAINSAWIVSQYENEYNPSHNHTFCEVSGVVYLKTPNVKGRRKFVTEKGKRDNDGNIAFVYSSPSDRPFDVLEKGIEAIAPEKGMMILFPSYLSHHVYPFIGKEERRSIAFNANYRITDDTDKNDIKFIAGNLSGITHDAFYTKQKPK